MAYSTIAHMGLFLAALSAVLATAGVLLFVVAHAGIKAMLFLIVGVLLDQHGTVDEAELHGLVPVFPDVAGAFALAAGQVRNGAAYSAQVLGDGGSAVIPVVAPHWTATGIGLSLLSTGLAVALAALAVRPPPIPRVLGPISRRCIDVLHEVHSGHVGDYVAWLLLGVTVLAALVLLG
ncbi:proton-conducting transporter transmembrane domain-containing protein [Saccharopolyspora sp. NPDC003762]